MSLSAPLTIGNLVLRNRIVLAPLTRGRAGLSRLPNDLIREYYEQRSGAGLIISEGVAISPAGYGWYGAPGLYTQEQSDAWKPVVDGTVFS
jgi:2,4-dienoyl-CoA reductase-like NADH-dependent reductase (Old Yellow Enzyme family)